MFNYFRESQYDVGGKPVNGIKSIYVDSQSCVRVIGG